MDISTVDQLNALCPNTMMETLGIEFTNASKGFVEATMPVDKRHHQPFGLMHGGASLALAETIGSVGSAMLVDTKNYLVVGLNMTCNHIGTIRSGKVIGKGEIIHQGRSTHIWDITVKSEEGKLISTFRFTNFIKPIRK